MAPISNSKKDLLHTLNQETLNRDRTLASLDDFIVGQIDMNRTDFRIMDLLIDGPSTPTELRQKILLTPSAMTSALDRLENLGYIIRKHDHSDRRKILVVPTDKYKDINALTYDPLQEDLNNELLQFNDEDLQTLIKYMKICSNKYIAFREKLKTNDLKEFKKIRKSNTE